MEEKKTIVLDFDGVVHSYISGWKGANHIPDPPVPYVAEAIDTLKEAGYEIVIWSTRCVYLKGRQAIRDWLIQWGITVDSIVSVKPSCICFVDDRAITFNGDWRQTMIDILKFKSYLDK